MLIFPGDGQLGACSLPFPFSHIPIDTHLPQILCRYSTLLERFLILSFPIPFYHSLLLLPIFLAISVSLARKVVLSYVSVRV